MVVVTADWLAEPGLQVILARLREAGHVGRCVGGAVRNALLGEPVSDIDIATTATPDVVLRLFGKKDYRAIPTGIDHGTVTVVAGGKSFEITTLRRDVATDGRHAKVAFSEDWSEDAERRDFTINALYVDADGTLFDPVGGVADLETRCVRFIGDPATRIAEDYLRILRFFRFYAQYGRGKPDRAGLEACLAMREGLGNLSSERVRAELLKLLAAPGAIPALDAMFDFGLLLPVFGLVPRIELLRRLCAIEAALGRSPDAFLRLGALVVEVTEDAEHMATRLKLSRREAARLAGMTRAADLETSETGDKTRLYRLGVEGYTDTLLLDWARSGAGSEAADWHARAVLPDCWVPPEFPLGGADIVALGMREGEAVGRLLRQLEEEWIAGGFLGDRAALCERARRAIAEA